MPNSKTDRKLYIGNIPPNIDTSTLVKLINHALKDLKATIADGDPVVSAWISPDGHYAFVEFRSVDEANNGFKLNNICIQNQPLKVGRPKTYVGGGSGNEDEVNACNTVSVALVNQFTFSNQTQ